MCLWFASWCCACPLILAVFTVFLALFCVDVPVFDEMGVLTSWTMFHGILGVEASRFSMRIQVLGR